MFRDKRVNHSFHYFSAGKSLFILKFGGNSIWAFFQATVWRECWRPSLYSILQHKDSSVHLLKTREKFMLINWVANIDMIWLLLTMGEGYIRIKIKKKKESRWGSYYEVHTCREWSGKTRTRCNIKANTIQNALNYNDLFLRLPPFHLLRKPSMCHSFAPV